MLTKPKILNLLLIISFLIVFFVYLLTSEGNTPYDYFLRLAKALMEGRYWLTEKPPWLSELIPWGNGRYYFVNPPMPAILALPFVLIFKESFQQQYLAHLIGSFIVLATAILAWRIKKSLGLVIWVAILTGLGSIVWFLSSTGSVWYLGQITAYLFLTLALIESLGKKRVFLVGILIACALFSRLQVLPSIILFIYLLKSKLNKKNLLLFLLGLAPFFVTYFLYNFIRFGNIFENGYTLIPDILKEPWFNYGQFSIFYIPKHLKIFLAGLPIISDKFPYIWPSWAGMAIWITTPAFIYSLTAPFNKYQVRLVWLTIIAIALINFSYGSTGFSQFGYRYAVDFYPFLTFLTIKGVAKTGLKWHHWLLLIIGVIVNLWGVLWINKFGWVSY